jgi:hypothetical protein
VERRKFLKSAVTAGATLALPTLARASVKQFHYDGADWHIKGEGIVCCPCTVPCPCRYNAPPSYGHCEATLYLRIKQGHYGDVSLDDMQLIESSGMCATCYQNRAILYFDRSSSQAQQLAWEKLTASVSPRGIAMVSYARVVPIQKRITDGRLYNISIAGILSIIVDRNWGQSSPPMPWVAAPDHFSNTIQYVQNIRYRVHDPQAGLDFDYSHRQANYRIVDLGIEQFRSNSMLIQFADGQGWFNARQLDLIKAQHLALPNLQAIEKEVAHLRAAKAL